MIAEREEQKLHQLLRQFANEHGLAENWVSKPSSLALLTYLASERVESILKTDSTRFSKLQVQVDAPVSSSYRTAVLSPRSPTSPASPSSTPSPQAQVIPISKDWVLVPRRVYKKMVSAEKKEDENVVKLWEVAESKSTRKSRSKESSELLPTIENPFALLLEQEKIVKIPTVKPVKILKEFDVYNPFAMLAEV